MSDPITGKPGAGTAAISATAAATSPVRAIATPDPTYAADPRATPDHVEPPSEAAPRGAVPGTMQGGGIGWGRVGIVAGMAPVAYVQGIILHEAVGHGGMALALGANDVTVTPYPHTYTRDDGSTGLRFASMSYHTGPDWSPTKEALVSLGPSMLDTALIAGGTTLYETGNWPKNPWASGALLVTQAASTVDLGFNGVQGLIQPRNGSVDTVKAANDLGVPPQLIAGIQTGIAVAGLVEAGRIAYHVLQNPTAPAAPKSPAISPTFSSLPGGGMIGVSGTF